MPSTLETDTSRIGAVTPGPALCGRDGEVASVYGGELTEQLIEKASGYRYHGGCKRCLSVHRGRI